MFSQTLKSRWQTPDLSAFEEEIQNYLDSPMQQLAPKSSARPQGSPFGLNTPQEQRISQDIAKLGTELAPKTSPRANMRVGNLADMTDEEVFARTVMGEAGGESQQGMQAVANVIMNRAKKQGKSVRDIALAPGQFSMWNGVTGYAKGEGALDPFNMRVKDEIYGLVGNAMSGNLDDVTGGALNYYNPHVADPKWGKNYGGNFPTTIGNHIFGWAK